MQERVQIVSSMLYQSNVFCIKANWSFYDHANGEHGAFVYWLPGVRMGILDVIMISIVIVIMVFVIILIYHGRQPNLYWTPLGLEQHFWGNCFSLLFHRGKCALPQQFAKRKGSRKCIIAHFPSIRQASAKHMSPRQWLGKAAFRTPQVLANNINSWKWLSES